MNYAHTMLDLIFLVVSFAYVYLIAPEKMLQYINQAQGCILSYREYHLPGRFNPEDN